MQKNENLKKTKFWKYLITASTIMLGITSATEARVTREVAEATIPYLLEAVGIPSSGVPDTDTARRDAIVHMLYTDDGQRQMVDWVINGINPPTLNATGPFALVGTYVGPGAVTQRMNIQALFPCGPGTFSSYATNVRRLGYHALNYGTPQILCQRLFAAQTEDVANVMDVLEALNCLYRVQQLNAQRSQQLANYLNIQLRQGNNEAKTQQLVGYFNEQARQNNRTYKEEILSAACDVIVHAVLSTANDIDTKLAIVLFVLDICDTADQVFDIIDGYVNAGNNIVNYVVGQAGTRNNIINPLHNEYNHRPVSATSVQGQGDCVQTLYRHLINIAVQNDSNNPRNFNVGHLPNALKHGYYGPVYVQNHNGNIQNPNVQVQNILAIPVRNGEAGITWLVNHQRWNDALLASVPQGTNIINGSINDIITVLGAVRPAGMATSALNTIARAYIAPALNPTIHTSTGVDGAGTNQQANATAIQNALNALDGRCNAGNERFIVSVTDNMLNPQVVAIQNQVPNRVNALIEIVDKLWNRRIIIGIWASGHAEIIIIQ